MRAIHVEPHLHNDAFCYVIECERELNERVSDELLSEGLDAATLAQAAADYAAA